MNPYVLGFFALVVLGAMIWLVRLGRKAERSKSAEDELDAALEAVERKDDAREEIRETVDEHVDSFDAGFMPDSDDD